MHITLFNTLPHIQPYICMWRDNMHVGLWRVRHACSHIYECGEIKTPYSQVEIGFIKKIKNDLYGVLVFPFSF